ncbi:MAG: hypothetical protein QOE90_3519 [Thermoplasmata archaeon]|nr:hypothetical protein [Thermoplasmata archaeon]
MACALPRDLTQPEDCPHCGWTCKNHMAMWRHKQRCDDNPDPPCRWCGLKFEPHKLPPHQGKCAKNPANLPTAKRALPSPWTVPSERLTPTDLIVHQLMVDPGEPPPFISEMAWPSPVAQEPLVDVETLGPFPDLPLTNRVSRRRATRPPAAPPAGPQKSASRPPSLLFHALVKELRQPPEAFLLRLGFAAARVPGSARSAARRPVDLVKRPPYNPMIHGSVESYRATYGLPRDRQIRNDEEDGETTS